MSQTLAELTPSRLAWVEERLADMSLADLAGQVLLGAFFRSPMLDAQGLVAAGKLGGILPTTREMPDPAAAHSSIEAMRARAPLPLLVACDFETGVAQFVRRGATRLPPAMALGAQPTASRRAEAVRSAATVTALEALALGVTLNFAPVGDLFSNPENSIIAQRAFGADPAAVAAAVGEYVAAAQALGMACAVKHFPGHGATSGDSHLELPVCALDGRRLAAVELAPFRAAIEAGVAAVMVAHIHVPALQPAAERKPVVPASLSPSIVQGVLRERMGFEGVIVTDSLSMQAITRRWPPSEAAVAALRAGCDLLIVEEAFVEVHEAIVDAADSGKLSTERLRASVRRILTLKARLEEVRGALDTHSLGVVGCDEHAEEALAIARGAVTLLQGELSAGRAAIEAAGGARVLAFFNAPRATALGNPSVLASMLGGLGVEREATTHRIGRIALHDDADEIAVDEAVRLLSSDEPFVLALFRKTMAYRADGLALAPPLKPLFEAAVRRAAAIVLFGAPLSREEWGAASPRTPVLVAYGSDAASSIAAGEALLGDLEPAGNAPLGAASVGPAPARAD